MLNENSINEIKYVKPTADTTETNTRHVIPLEFQPGILTIDVSDLSSEDAESMLTMVTAYSEYKMLHMTKMFSFEDFVEQTFNVTVQPKWRRLKPEFIEIQ